MDAFPVSPAATQADLVLPDVMLLAAGLGTRMRPLTFDRPKALIEVAGKPLIDHVIDCALAEGARKFVVNIHHKPDLMAAHIARLASALPDLTFETSYEKDRLLDTGGGLKHALPLLGSDPVLVMNTDSFWLPGSDNPIARLVAEYAKDDADCVLLCVEPDKATGFNKGADFLIDGEGNLGQTVGRPVVYAGTAVFSRELASLGPDVPFSLARSFGVARDRGRIKGIMIQTPWYHVGDPAAIVRTEQAIGTLV